MQLTAHPRLRSIISPSDSEEHWGDVVVVEERIDWTFVLRML
jgi:hypothetical protein